MTREQAIQAFYCPDLYGGLYGKEYGQAISIAIESLRTIENMDNTLHNIAEQITIVKETVITENSEFLKGYVAALSAVEEMIEEELSKLEVGE